MRGFVFTIDALFAVTVSLTIILSLYLLIEQVQITHAERGSEFDILSVLDKTGSMESITSGELDNMLSGYNRCGSLILEKDGGSIREVIACGCDPEGEFYSGKRSYVKHTQTGTDYMVASLKTCPRFVR